MKIIYDAADVTDAHLVKNLLAEHDIAAFVRGEHLQGALGELPMGGMVQVSVADGDAVRAREVIEAWQQSAVTDESDGQAWDDEDNARHGPVDPGAPTYARASTPQAPSSRFGRGLLIGAAVGVLATWAAMRIPRPQDVDFNGDGTRDEVVMARGGGGFAVDTDRNTDARWDEVFTFDRTGTPVTLESDDDFDGRMESMSRYTRGQWTSSHLDYDGDGLTDRRSQAVHGVIAVEEWLDPNQNVVKRVRYEGGRRIGDEIDTNGDGTLDTQRKYDAREEPITAGG